ncbi:MAG: hypothetical protein ACK4TA_09790 [Saprospiraceae bacterium]
MATTISRKKKQKMQELDKRDNQRFMSILIGATLVLLIIMYFIFQSSF